MPQIGFNPKALSGPVTPVDSNVRHAGLTTAFEPVVIDGTGVEAILEGLRLANIKGFESPKASGGSGNLRKDVDP